MTTSGLTLTSAVIAGIALAAALSMPLAALEQSATVTKSFTLSAVDGRRTLVVDNVNGAIEIEAGTGSIVTLTLKETFKAKSAEEMTRARQEVALEVTEHPGRLELVQGGPWRCRGRARARPPADGITTSWTRPPRRRSAAAGSAWRATP